MDCSVALQAPPSTEFSRQEILEWVATPGELLDSGIKLMSFASPALADRFFTAVLSGKPGPSFSFQHFWTLHKSPGTGNALTVTRNILGALPLGKA